MVNAMFAVVISCFCFNFSTSTAENLIDIIGTPLKANRDGRSEDMLFPKEMITRSDASEGSLFDKLELASISDFDAREADADALEDQISAFGANEGFSDHIEGRKSLLTTAQQTIFNATDRTRELVNSIFVKGRVCSARNGMKGICIQSKQCTPSVSGIPEEGTCGKAGYVCCVSVLTCGRQTSSGLSYFVNPEYPKPSTVGRMCETIVYKTHQNICQYRVTLETFELAAPINGECVTDAFTVSGHNRNFEIPQLCGHNSKQHFIIPVDQATCGTRLTFVTAGSKRTRRWRIKITQVQCDSPLAAPQGCLKYYLTTSGVMKSFNVENIHSKEGYFNHLNYAMCIKRANNFCGVTLSSSLFHVSHSSPNCSSINCSTDFIQIPPGKRESPARICGDRFNHLHGKHIHAPIRLDITTPLVFYFKSSGEGPKPKGFIIDYQQNLCR